MDATTATGTDAAPAPRLFERVVCGVDGSPESVEAARQAAALLEEGGSLTLVAVADLAVAAEAGFLASQVDAELRAEAEAALAAASDAIAGRCAVETRLFEGRVPVTIVDEIRRSGATLAVVGSHGVKRAVGILLGGVATTLLHDSPCSVLVARAPAKGEWRPRAIAVGVDGSEAADRALEVATALGRRFAAPVRRVLGTEGTWIYDIDHLRMKYRPVDVHHEKPVPALVEVSADADLLVLGSRGARGLKALGSVSERVAHRARCSVLVVR
jgi:nucleotide-binding universal stress UspA family protein